MFKKPNKLQEKSDEALWRAADIPGTGDLILQLRNRAAQATKNSRRNFWALLAVLALGITWYIGRPLLFAIWDGQKSVFETQISTSKAELARLVTNRNALRDKLANALSPAGRPVPSGTGKALTDLRTLNDGQTLVAVGSGGTIARSTDKGETWALPPTGTVQTLTDLRTLSDGQTLVAVGSGGTIARSTDKGETWALPPSGTEQTLTDLRALSDGQTLVAVGLNGTIARSTDKGETWALPPTGTVQTLYDLRALSDGQTLVAVGSGGTIARSTDKGETWTLPPSGTVQTLIDLRALSDGKTLVAVGWGDAIARSTDKGETWTLPPSGTVQTLIDLRALSDGQTLVAVGSGGTIARSTDKGETWALPPSGTVQTLYDLRALSDGQTLVAVGSGGTIARSTDKGETWALPPTGTVQTLTDLRTLSDGQTLVAVGEGGTILFIDDKLGTSLRSTDQDDSKTGDDAFRTFLKDLPKPIAQNPEIASLTAQLAPILAPRDTLEANIATAEENLAQLRSGTLSRAEREAAFATFMTACKGDAADPSAITACAQAFAAQEAAQSDTWWEILAEQVPPAILLLFLLATLSALYRYNLRLAGFHNSRADVLELAALRGDTTDPEALRTLSEAMAADKVEFARANTPADQATEIAKAVFRVK